MSDKLPEDTDVDLARKQAAELEESIVAQRGIVEDLKAKGEDTTEAREFLEVLLTCRSVRRPRARSYIAKKARKDAAEG